MDKLQVLIDDIQLKNPTVGVESIRKEVEQVTELASFEEDRRLLSAFRWRDSPQGMWFWSAVYYGRMADLLEIQKSFGSQSQ